MPDTPAPPVSKPPGMVRVIVSKAVTTDVRITVGLALPCDEEDYQETYDRLKEFVTAKISELETYA